MFPIIRDVIIVFYVEIQMGDIINDYMIETSCSRVRFVTCSGVRRGMTYRHLGHKAPVWMGLSRLWPWISHAQ